VSKPKRKLTAAQLENLRKLRQKAGIGEFAPGAKRRSSGKSSATPVAKSSRKRRVRPRAASARRMKNPFRR